MKEVKLTNSEQVALVDDQDYDTVNLYKWYLRDGYVYATHIPNLALHNYILGQASVLKTDHKDCDKLNNTRSNLRYATNSQNKANGGMYKCNTTGYKGVTWRTERGTYRAQIRKNNKLTIIGTYHNIDEAARAYDRKAIEFFGEFANTNFPREEYV